MRPIELTMQAFGSYGKKTTIDFTKPNQNVFLVTGDTGSGKSTIFDAIVFALYGEGSSSTNKKDGILLQSQFVPLSVEPFVELIFSDGPTQEQYRVRRTPRHLRLLTKGAGKGVATREVVASISLQMPDGTEYPAKEANKKIEEIVGLSKGQFMQVAMIAQGEFMELLRAKSDEKKVIFRRLFGTGLYQGIVDELGERRKTRERELAILKTECQTLTGRIKIPESYEEHGRISVLKDSVVQGHMASMEELVHALKLLCAFLEGEREKALSKQQEASRRRDEIRDALAGAAELDKHFEQAERAAEELARIEEQQPGMEEKERLLARLGAAYEVQADYLRYEDVSRRQHRVEKAVEEQKEALPGLQELMLAGSAQELKARKQYEDTLQAYTELSEKVNRACRIFEEIEEAGRLLKTAEKALAEAKEEENQTQKQLLRTAEKAENYRIFLSEHEQTPQELFDAESLTKEAVRLKEELDRLLEERAHLLELEKSSERSTLLYQEASIDFQQKNSEYLRKRQSFLDAQAGLLAKELKPGMPCPVCGSRNHPLPCPWNPEQEEISQELLESLEKEAEELRNRQEELAARARSELEILQEKSNVWKKGMDRLYASCRASVGALTDPAGRERFGEKEYSPDGFREELEAWLSCCRDKEEGLRNVFTQMQDIQAKSVSLQEEREQIRSRLETIRENISELTAKVSGHRSVLERLSAGKEFEDKNAALGALASMAEDKKRAEDQAKAAHESAEEAARKEHQAQTMIRTYSMELEDLRE